MTLEVLISVWRSIAATKQAELISEYYKVHKLTERKTTESVYHSYPIYYITQNDIIHWLKSTTAFLCITRTSACRAWFLSPLPLLLELVPEILFMGPWEYDLGNIFRLLQDWELQKFHCNSRYFVVMETCHWIHPTLSNYSKLKMVS